MRVVLVGSGNVATHIAFALLAAKIEVVQVWSKQIRNAQILADQTNATAIANLYEIDKDADFCILSIKDDAISNISDQLVGFNGIIVHTSGAVNLTVFEKHFKKYGVLYPLQTFSLLKEVDFKKVPVCIEANSNEVLQTINDLAVQLSEKVLVVTSEKRRILHLAAVFACNFTNHLYALSSDVLAEHKLEFDLIRPLILETAEKVQYALPKEVQTGPAIRNDEQTMRKHEELLLEQPQLLTIYQILSESIKKTKK